MYAYGWLLPSWIMQSCDNICSSFFKLSLGPLDIKPISKPCVMAGQVVTRGFK